MANFSWYRTVDGAPSQIPMLIVFDPILVIMTYTKTLTLYDRETPK